MRCIGPEGSPVETSIRGPAAASAAWSVPTGSAAARIVAHAPESRTPPKPNAEPNERKLRRHFWRTIVSTRISMALSTAAKPLTRPFKVSPKPSAVAKMSPEKVSEVGCKVFFDRSLRSFLGGSVRGPVDRSKGGSCGCSSPSETIPAPGLWTVDSLAMKTADGARRSSGGLAMAGAESPCPSPR